MVREKNFQPNQNGYYGSFGGAYIPEMLHRNVEELRSRYLEIMNDAEFQQEFQALLPARLRFTVQLLIEVAAAGMFALMAVASVVSISNNLNNQTATLEMPYWLFMAPMTIGMTLLTLESLAQLRRTWRQGHADNKQTTLA